MVDDISSLKQTLIQNDTFVKNFTNDINSILNRNRKENLSNAAPKPSSYDFDSSTIGLREEGYEPPLQSKGYAQHAYGDFHAKYNYVNSTNDEHRGRRAMEERREDRTFGVP